MRRSLFVMLTSFAVLLPWQRVAHAIPNCGLPDKDPCPDPCDEDPTPPRCNQKPPLTGTILPKYLILTVVYAPPGSAGNAKSEVDYGTESSTGSSVSTSHSFKSDTEVSFSLMGAFSFSGGFGASSTDDKSVEIKKTTGMEIKVAGGSQDGINHDADVIYLWLKPSVTVVARDKKARWSLAPDGGTMDIQYVYVGWLKTPSTMPAGVADRLKKFGLTDADYKTILGADPFANGSTTIDPKRFQQTITTFPYEPPYQQGDSTPTWSLTLKDETTTTTKSTYEFTYSVGASVSGDLTSWLGLSAKDTFTWTNSQAFGASSGGAQSASCSVAGPSYGYTGATDLAVYWDTLYGSFLFAPAADPVMATGKVVTDDSKPVAHKEVILKVAGKKLRTFTDSRGEYKFVGKLRGRGSVVIDGQARAAVIAAKPRLTLFKLKSWVEP